MPNLLRILPVSMAFAGLSSLAFAQTGPQLTVGPGLIYTVASRATINLSSASFNGIAFKSNPATLYVSDAHSERNNQISLGNVYAIDLTTGGVTRVAGTAPDHTNGNIANCTAGAQAVCPGDGGPATSANLHEPTGLALDSAGNLFIADDRQQVIRRVDAATGVITTVAGTGNPNGGFSGDNGPARNAAFAFPSGIAFDGSNNLYIADTLNHRIRVITASNGVIDASHGVINTAAGTTAGFGGDNGPATSAQLNQPFGVAVDRAGNIFIADSANNAIREVTPADGKINTVAGQGGVAGYSGDGGSATSATLQYPIGIAVDAGGSLYIADNRNNVVRKVTGDANHTISTIAGNGTAGYSGDNGPAFTARLSNPTNMIMDGQNNLYFVDGPFSAVRKITGTAAPLTLPLTATGSTGSSAFPLTLSNTGGQTLNVSSITFPSNFTAGSGGTCPPGSFNLAPGASCTLPVNFVPTSGGSTNGTLAFNGNQPGGTTNVTLSETNGLYFVPVPLCRVIDTRLSNPNFGGPIFSAKETRNYAIRNSTGLGCAASYIPAAANVQAYSLNVTVVPPGPLTFVTAFPGRTTLPNVSTLNSYDGRTKANAAIVPANTGDSNREISIYASDPTHVIVDINGYYVPEADPPANNNGQTPLAYYPLPPCRAIDTRANSGSTGSGVPLLANTTTNYTLAGTCGLPANAQAYALNYTALPRTGNLRYITTWPTGGTQPIVSTINATTGAITANAAILPAPVSANGSVSVFTTEDTDLIIDVAGYYAPPSTNGLALYNLTPCRVYDSRFAGGAPGTGAPLSGDATYNTNIGSSCGASPTAQSYVLNTTVIPNQGKPMRYLTAWAQSSGQPLQSVVNASDGAVSSNLAVVPTVNGSVSTYVSETTGLILDLSAYFAP